MKTTYCVTCADSDQKLPGNYNRVAHQLQVAAAAGRPSSDARRQWVRAATQC